MKSDMNRRYHTRVITNIIYSAIISCLVEIFLVTNVSMIARYMEESGRMNGLIQQCSATMWRWCWSMSYPVWCCSRLRS